MKVSISLSEADVRRLETFMKANGITSRSAAIQRAIRALDDERIGDEYEAAWDEWYSAGDAALWDATVGDGLDGADFSDWEEK